MQTRFSDEKAVRPSVCLSVRPSVKRVNCDETEERPVQIILYNTKKIEASFPRRMVGGERPLLPEILGQLAPVGTK